MTQDTIGLMAFPFGKYRGKQMKDIAKTDPGYLRWFADLNPDSRAARAAQETVYHLIDKPAGRPPQPTWLDLERAAAAEPVETTTPRPVLRNQKYQ